MSTVKECVIVSEKREEQSLELVIQCPKTEVATMAKTNEIKLIEPFPKKSFIFSCHIVHGQKIRIFIDNNVLERLPSQFEYKMMVETKSGDAKVELTDLHIDFIRGCAVSYTGELDMDTIWQTPEDPSLQAFARFILKLSRVSEDSSGDEDDFSITDLTTDEVELVVNDESIMASKHLLSKYSKVFKDLFMNAEKNHESKVVLNDVEFESLQDLVTFVKTKKLDIKDVDHGICLLQLADIYQCRKLMKHVQHYLILKTDETNAISMLLNADTFNAPRLKKYCACYLADKVEESQLTTVKESLEMIESAELLHYIIGQINRTTL
ncbi:hypothetical protein HDE_08256 [Halotydeus destructor]|nr:hypothetical protein HDE_08256 [Halotydeus destructor]